MEENKKLCPICGKPTRVYMGNARKDGLCAYHADLLKEGKIVNDNGTFVYADSKKPVGDAKQPSQGKASVTETGQNRCIVCDAPIGEGKFLCAADYKQAKELSSDLVKSTKDKMKLIVYYRNLRNNMFHIHSEDILKENIIKLSAIAMALDSGFNYHVFYNDLAEDVRKIKESHAKKKPSVSEVTKMIDEKNAEIFTTQDHHQMDSQGEVVIDDILFDLQKDPTLLRAQIAPYHIPHFDILDVTERGMNADWYIGIPTHPLADFYIEYWGVKNSATYEKNKKEKLSLYEKYGFALLGIEAEETKEPTALRMKIKDFLIKRTKEN